ncbi:MAG: methyltransferase domain-containing protein [Verrucomicrobiales bacterium]
MNTMTLTKNDHHVVRREWTEESVNRFWDHFAQRDDTSQKYFSRMAADQLTKLLRDTGRLKGKMLDYGCGPGYLLDKLTGEQIECYGADPSPESVEQTQNRLRGRSNWKGCIKMNGHSDRLRDGVI